MTDTDDTVVQQDTDTSGTRSEEEQTDDQQQTQQQTRQDAGAETDDGRDDADREADKDAKANEREKRYRVERNQARAERDSALAKVDALQRQIINGMVEQAGMKSNALWTTRTGDDAVSGLCGEDGSVDADKVQAAVKHARDALGLGPQRPGVDRTLGQTTGGVSVKPDQQWTQAFTAKGAEQ